MYRKTIFTLLCLTLVLQFAGSGECFLRNSISYAATTDGYESADSESDVDEVESEEYDEHEDEDEEETSSSSDKDKKKKNKSNKKNKKSAKKKEKKTKGELLSDFAKTFKGKIKYKWGGKPTRYYKSSHPSSLDCSGFIMFVYWSYLKHKDNRLYSTYSITSDLRKTSRASLKPGDLGTIYSEGSAYIIKYKSKKGKIVKKKFYEQDMAEDYMKEKVESLEEKIDNRKKNIEKYKLIKNECEEQLKTFENIPENYTNTAIEQSIKASKDTIKKCEKKIKSEKKLEKNLKTRKKSYELIKKINHVGIYCGKNKKGQSVWCHCCSSGGGVVVQAGYNRFNNFYKVL